MPSVKASTTFQVAASPPNASGSSGSAQNIYGGQVATVSVTVHNGGKSTGYFYLRGSVAGVQFNQVNDLRLTAGASASVAMKTVSAIPTSYDGQTVTAVIQIYAGVPSSVPISQTLNLNFSVIAPSTTGSGGHSTICANLRNQETNLTNQINSLSSQISTLESQIAFYQAEISQFQSEGYTAGVQSAESNLSSAQSQLSSLQSQQNSLANQYSSIAQQLQANGC